MRVLAGLVLADVTLETRAIAEQRAHRETRNMRAQAANGGIVVSRMPQLARIAGRERYKGGAAHPAARMSAFTISTVLQKEEDDVEAACSCEQLLGVVA